jgi:hypothetical protein
MVEQKTLNLLVPSSSLGSPILKIQASTVPAKDIYHNTVKTALQKVGWTITHDLLLNPAQDETWSF